MYHGRTNPRYDTERPVLTPKDVPAHYTTVQYEKGGYVCVTNAVHGICVSTKSFMLVLELIAKAKAPVVVFYF